MNDKRITDAPCFDAALVMGVLYTLIYAAMVWAVLVVDIPEANEKTVGILVGAMTIIQTTIVNFFFGSSKNAESTQRLIAASKERTDTALREIATQAVPAAPVKAADVDIQASGNVTVEGNKP